MNSAITPSTPQIKKHLSRDQKLQIHTLNKAGLCQEKIAKQLQVTKRQVQYTIRNHLLSPKKRSGRPSALSEEQVDELVLFVTSSSATRRMTYLELSCIAFPNWNVSERVIKGALNRRGYERRMARHKPALTEERKQARLDFAERHYSWSLEQWSKILWTDETWVTGSFHSGTWITRKRDEAYSDDCIVPSSSRASGWMFWGSFSGNEKGPFLFWEKEWGSITAGKYCQRIVPLIEEKVLSNRSLLLMQDNAPSHSARATKAELSRRGINLIPWPPFSPDLNPIEHVWDSMKDYMQKNFPELEGRSRVPGERLRQMVVEAWESISSEYLLNLIESMPNRCQAVIEARGGATSY